MYISLALASAVSFTFAQKQTGIITKMPEQKINISKTPTDTLDPGNSMNATGYVLIGCQDGGYVLGTNSYGDYAKAEQFIVTPSSSYKIEGAIYWVGAKKIEIAGSPNTVDFTVWDMNGTNGTTTAGSGQQCPNTVLASVTMSMGDVDTSSTLSNAQIIMFTSPILVTSDYAIGIDVQNTYNDTIGMVSTQDGDGGGYELCWEKWNDGNWYTLQGGGWGGGTLDIDMMVLPIVDMNTGNIDDNYFIFGMKMTAYPNPARNETTIAYELEKDANNVVIEILNANGKLVNKIEQGVQNKGVHSTNIDLSDLSNGNYFISLNSNGQKLIKRIIIVK